MKRFSHKLFFLLFTIIASTFAVAGNTGFVDIVNYKTSSIGTIVYVQQDITNVTHQNQALPACITTSTDPIKSVFLDRTENTTYTDFVASMMLAISSGKQVAFWLDQNADCNMEQGGPHAIATMVYVQN